MKKTTWTNPNVDCFWLTSKIYMLPGLTQYYKDRIMKMYNFPESLGLDPSHIVTTYSNEILNIIIYENNFVRYTFNNGRPMLEEQQTRQGAEALKDLLSYLGWRSVLSCWSNDEIYNE